MANYGSEITKVLVTGGSGHLGANLIYHLADQGFNVLCLLNPAEGVDTGLENFLSDVQDNITYLSADIRSSDVIDDLFSRHQPSHVIHAAAITQIDPQDTSAVRMIFDVNVRGTMNILEASRHNAVKRIVHLSSAAVYGRGEGSTHINEAHPLQPYDFYGYTKAAGERLCKFYLSDLQAIDVVIIRLGYLYGPFERPIPGSRVGRSLVYELVNRVLANDHLRLAHLDYVRDWIHVYDTSLVTMMLLTADVLPHRIYNLSAGIEISHRQVLEALARFLPVTYEQVDENEANVAPNLTEKRRWPLNINRLLEDFEYTPTLELQEGLQQYVDWIREHPDKN